MSFLLFLKYKECTGMLKNFLRYCHFITLDKPKVKILNNVELLKKLSFYDELSIVKSKTAFTGYAQSYKIEVIDKRNVIVQLKAS